MSDTGNPIISQGWCGAIHWHSGPLPSVLSTHVGKWGYTHFPGGMGRCQTKYFQFQFQLVLIAHCCMGGGASSGSKNTEFPYAFTK